MAPSKILFFLVISFLAYTTSNAANHYVDKNATSGGNNGTSWANAWQSFSAINWGSISPGDIIYVSGGTDSTIYYEHLLVQASGTAANHITIRNSYDSGHNGRVILDGEDHTGYGIRIGVSAGDNPDYIYIKGLEVRKYGLGVHLNWAVNVITLDSLIVSDNYGRCINVQGDDTVIEEEMGDSITIKNCHLTTPVDVPYETDGIYLKYTSNAVVHDNFIHIKNASDVNRHSDGIQTNPVKGLRLYNNVMICDSNTYGIVYIAGAVSEDGINDSVIIYNNYMYGGGIWRNGSEPWVTGLNPEFAQRWVPMGMQEAPHFIAHNTVVIQGPWYSGCHIAAPSTMVNNIIVQFEGSASPVTPPANGFDYVDGYLWLETFRNSSVPAVDSIRSNLMWTEWSTGHFRGGPFEGSKAYSWSDWVSMGGTGVNGDPLFVDQIGYIGDQGTLDGELQLGSPAINQGEDIQAVIEALGLPWTDINGNARDDTPDIGAYQYVPRGPDITPPEVTGATLLDSVTLRIIFSEPLDPSTAQNPNNYSINNGITVVSALLTGSVVTLTTSPHSIGTYTVTVSNVEDLAGNIVSPTANSADYEWTVIQDVTSPELIGIQIVEVDKVVLDFSEPLDASQVSNLGNYIISEQIQVLGAELNTTQTRICLTTDEHLIEHIYTIEIHNLTDLAGNVISSQANSAFYKKLDIGAPGYIEYLIECVDASATTDTNTSPQKTLDGLVNGDPDPNSRWAAEIMPQWIQFDLGAITDINLIAISFYNWNNGRIYEYSIQISNDENNWNEIVSNASSSSQEWTFNEFNPVLSARYVRIICESNNQANWAGVWEARIFEPDYPTSVETEPRTYALKQNYPNPFNPSTTISYSIPASLFVTLKLYDVLGSEVATLVNAEKPVGSYEVKFSAIGGSASGGDVYNLPSGVYFYRLQAGDFVETKKMVFMK